MLKKLCFLLVLISVISCKDGESDALIQEEPVWQVSIDSLPKKIAILPKAQKPLNNWKEYTVVERSFDKIYTVDLREDLVLLIEELIENQKKMEESTYPTYYDIPQIKGRQKVFKTFLLKIKGDLEYRQNPQGSLTQMVDAFNQLRNQFNVTVNSELPEELR